MERLARTLWNLFLACLNATLILVALCLWLGWNLVSGVRDITHGFAEDLVSLEPMQAELRQLSDEVGGLRSDLADVRSDIAEGNLPALAGLNERSAALETRLAEINERLSVVAEDPGILLDRAIETAAEEFGAAARSMRGCVPSGAEL